MDSNVRVLELAAQLTAFGILPVFFLFLHEGFVHFPWEYYSITIPYPLIWLFLRRIDLRQGLFLQSHKRFPLIF